MGALLALASAVLYGIADFAGGLLSRRTGFVTVALAGQAGGFLVLLAIAPFVPGDPTGGDLAWGALSGVGTGLAMVFLYRGLARGAMSVVVPITAVGGLALPVLAGVALLGDRPTPMAIAGMVLAVPALWLLSWSPGHTGSVDGLVAGLGVAVQYLALAQAGPDSGIWPVVAGRLAAALAILPAYRRDGRPPAGAWLTGVCAALALVAYLLATRLQLVSIAVVLSSLYPVIPVLLGLTVLRENLTTTRAAGLAGAAAATALITLSP